MSGPVMLGYVVNASAAYSGIRPEFMTSVLDLLTTEAGEDIGAVSHATAGGALSYGRNVLTQQFLASACDWLWTVDTDMVFSPGLLGQLLTAANAGDRPVVSALAWILDARTGPAPSVYRAVGAHDGLGRCPVFERLAAVPEGLLPRVDGTGAACLLIHREAAEKVQVEEEGLPVWWSHLTSWDGMELGEDLSFCARLGRAGVPLHLATFAQCGHIKPIMVGEVS